MVIIGFEKSVSPLSETDFMHEISLILRIFFELFSSKTPRELFSSKTPRELFSSKTPRNILVQKHTRNIFELFSSKIDIL